MWVNNITHVFRFLARCILCTMDADKQVYLSSCVHGYHIYNSNWGAIAREELQWVREIGNMKDRYPISVLRHSDVVGHLPQKISRLCSLFILRDGTITCIVSGHCRYSINLPQGGMEILCNLVFRGKKKYLLNIQKLKCVEKRLKQQLSLLYCYYYYTHHSCTWCFVHKL